MKLVINNISKTYPNGVRALDGISLSISKGLFGLLGPNGAGKSSLMRTIATLQEPDSGSIHFNDIDVLKQKNALRQDLGWLPQDFGLYPKISAEVLLNHFAVLKGMTKKRERNELVKTLLQKTNLYEVRNKNLEGFSGGMRQRFGIAQALIGNPHLIIVDEPTAGLDPGERNRFLNLLGELGEERIIILSTHVVEDVKELCTDMGIIQKGKLLLQGNPLQIINAQKGIVWSKRIDRADIEAYKSAYNVVSVKMLAGKYEIRVWSEMQPDPSFDAMPTELEDIYFSEISNPKTIAI